MERSRAGSQLTDMKDGAGCEPETCCRHCMERVSNFLQVDLPKRMMDACGIFACRPCRDQFGSILEALKPEYHWLEDEGSQSSSSFSLLVANDEFCRLDSSNGLQCDLCSLMSEMRDSAAHTHAGCSWAAQVRGSTQMMDDVGRTSLDVQSSGSFQQDTSEAQSKTDISSQLPTPRPRLSHTSSASHEENLEGVSNVVSAFMGQMQRSSRHLGENLDQIVAGIAKDQEMSVARSGSKQADGSSNVARSMALLSLNQSQQSASAKRSDYNIAQPQPAAVPAGACQDAEADPQACVVFSRAPSENVSRSGAQQGTGLYPFSQYYQCDQQEELVKAETAETDMNLDADMQVDALIAYQERKLKNQKVPDGLFEHIEGEVVSTMQDLDQDENAMDVTTNADDMVDNIYGEDLDFPADYMNERRECCDCGQVAGTTQQLQSRQPPGNLDSRPMSQTYHECTPELPHELPLPDVCDTCHDFELESIDQTLNQVCKCPEHLSDCSEARLAKEMQQMNPQTQNAVGLRQKLDSKGNLYLEPESRDAVEGEVDTAMDAERRRLKAALLKDAQAMLETSSSSSKSQCRHPGHQLTSSSTSKKESSSTPSRLTTTTPTSSLSHHAVKCRHQLEASVCAKCGPSKKSNTGPMAVNFSYTSPQTQKTKLKFQVGKDISSTTDTTTKDRVLAKRSSQNRIAANLESPRALTHKKAAQESSAKAKKPTVVRPEDTQKRVAGVETDEVLYKSLSKRTSSFQMCNCKEEEAEAARIAKQLANVERDVEDHQHPEKEYSQVMKDFEQEEERTRKAMIQESEEFACTKCTTRRTVTSGRRSLRDSDHAFTSHHFEANDGVATPQRSVDAIGEAKLSHTRRTSAAGPANLMNFELPGSRISGLTGNLASVSSFGIVDQTATECMILPQNRKKLVPQQAESGGKIFSRINSNLAQDLCVGCSISKSMKQTEHGRRDQRGSNVQEKMQYTQEKHSRVNQEFELAGPSIPRVSERSHQRMSRPVSQHGRSGLIETFVRDQVHHRSASSHLRQPDFPDLLPTSKIPTPKHAPPVPRISDFEKDKRWVTTTLSPAGLRMTKVAAHDNIVTPNVPLCGYAYAFPRLNPKDMPVPTFDSRRDGEVVQKPVYGAGAPTFRYKGEKLPPNCISIVPGRTRDNQQ